VLELHVYYHAWLRLTFNKAALIETVGQNESPKIDQYKYDQLIFKKGAKEIHRRKGSLFKKLYFDAHMQKKKKKELQPKPLYKN
jgi:hypothetical protein